MICLRTWKALIISVKNIFCHFMFLSKSLAKFSCSYKKKCIREMSTVYMMFVFASFKSTKYSNTTKKFLLPYVCSSNRSTTLHFFSRSQNDWECTKLTPCSDFAFFVFQTILKTSIQTPYKPNLNFWGSYKAAQLANIFI